MGAIAAALGRSSEPSTETVARMLAAVPHRGAEQSLLRHGSCVLGVRAHGAVDADLGAGDRLAAAFSGSLDNLAELAADAAPRGASEPAGPARLLVELFERAGDSAVARLRGEFEAVVTDGRRLWCFRDHLGFGTLFYREDAAGLRLGTEAKQVVAGAGIPREPDLAVLEAGYYQTADECTPSALRGVRRLPRATVLAAADGRVRLQRYWRPESLLETSRLSAGDIPEAFDELMTTAVSRILTGPDVVSLSGGIDSPAIAAYAVPAHTRLTGEPIAALAAVYPQHPSVDERSYIELVAGALGMPLHLYEKTADDLDRVREWTELADGPVPTVSLPQYEEHFVRARDLGFGTVLTGELAEFVVDMRSHLFAHLLFAGRFASLWKQLAAQRTEGASLLRVARHIASALVPTAVTRQRLLQQRGGIPDWLDSRRANQASAQSLVRAGERWRKVQLAAFHGSGVSVEAERICQELCGVRTRRPWADVDLWEFFLGLSAETKFPDPRSKTLVRQLLRGKVPDAILDRRDKTVFDEAIMARVDGARLLPWLRDPSWHMPGVDYDTLVRRLESGHVSLVDFLWAKDLAGVHAFVSLWDGSGRS